jgi:hypothetical protein
LFYEYFSFALLIQTKVGKVILMKLEILFDSQKFNLERMLEREKNRRNANLMAKIRPLVIHKLIVKMDVRYFRGESLHLLGLIWKHDIT